MIRRHLLDNFESIAAANRAAQDASDHHDSMIANSGYVKKRCWLCEQYVIEKAKDKRRLYERHHRVRSERPRLCGQCQQHIGAVIASSGALRCALNSAEVYIALKRWAIGNAIPITDNGAENPWLREHKQRAACPLCLNTGSHGVGYVVPGGIEMHLRSSKCPVVGMILRWQNEAEVAQREAVEVSRLVEPLKSRKGDGSDGGFVYLIADKHTKHVKIGLSKNPKDRWQSLRTATAVDLDLVAVIETNKMRATEDELHRQFSHLRVRGEWFKWDESIFRRFGVQEAA